MKPGRNDPCPCGSGKKYKHCCLRAADNEISEAPENLAWRRLRAALEGFAADMLRFINSAYGPPAIHEAWEEFTLGEEEVFEADSRHMQVFMPWFFHCWSPDPADTDVADKSLHGVTPTRAYLERRGRRLDPLLRGYLEGCVTAAFSYFDVLRSDPGRGMRLRDIMTAGEHEVSERSASRSMQRGDIVFGQLVATQGVTIMEACPGFSIPPVHKGPIVELRKRIAARGDPSAPAYLRDWDIEMIKLYQEIATMLFDPRPPEIQNTDGDPLSPRRLVFDIESAQEAFDALKHLALDVGDQELLADAERDAHGKLLKVRFDWRKRGNAVHAGWDNTVMGSIEIDRGRLSAEVNSELRAAQLQEAVDRALGTRARLRATKIQSVKKMLAEARGQGGAKAAERDAEQRALAERPEVKAKLAEMLAQHCESWVNQELPALGGRTPLQAVADADGREVVEALVVGMEQHYRRLSPQFDEAVMRRLRERLGLTG